MSIIRVKTISMKAKQWPLPTNYHVEKTGIMCFSLIICKESPRQWLKFYHCFLISFPLWLFASMPLKHANVGIFHHEHLPKLHPHSVDVQQVQSKFATNIWPSQVIQQKYIHPQVPSTSHPKISPRCPRQKLSLLIQTFIICKALKSTGG